MSQQLQHIAVKGTKTGLVLILDDRCAFSDLIEDIQHRLPDYDDTWPNGPTATVTINTGQRLLNTEDEQTITQLLYDVLNVQVAAVTSDVILKTEAEEIAEDNRTQMNTYVRNIRSGQVIDVTGDVLIIGDIHSGAWVKATGHIFVMGTIKGSVCAGSEGALDKVISATTLSPIQIMIAEQSLSGAELTDIEEEKNSVYIDKDRQQLCFDNYRRLAQRLTMS